jgi:glycosyltransferase involved in cell wall biosynthesis
MSQKATLLSIVVPDYNEEHTIGDIIDRLKATLQKNGLKSEIIVIDDHSRDRSAEISLKKHAKVYSLKQHMGKFSLRAFKALVK